MLIDCDGCAARGPGCPDCVITVLLGAPPQGVELDEVECQALAVLADGGLVPPLRLAPAPSREPAPVAARSARPGPAGQAEPGRKRANRGCGAGEHSHRDARHAAG
jgi:hypothetical protein